MHGKFALLCCLVSSVALAEEGGGESYAPAAKDIEVTLSAPPFLNASNLSYPGVVRGFGVNVASGNGGSATGFGLGLNGGAAYYITDMIAVGAVLGVNVGSIAIAGVGGGGGVTAFEFGVEPFAKFSFGRMMKLNPRLNPFVTGGLGLGLVGASGGGGGTSGALFIIEADPGVEFYLTKNWAITGFLPLALWINGSQGTVVNFSFGLGYGVALHF